MRSLTYLYRTLGPAKLGADAVTSITPKPAAEARQSIDDRQKLCKTPDPHKVLRDLR